MKSTSFGGSTQSLGLPRTTLNELATIALLVTALTVIARGAFPLWDDGLVWLQNKHGGGKAIFDSLADRPINGRIFQLLADHGVLLADGQLVALAGLVRHGLYHPAALEVLLPSAFAIRAARGLPGGRAGALPNANRVA